MRGLADAGHQVTVISPYPQKAPIANYRDYPIVGIVEAVQSKFEHEIKYMFVEGYTKLLFALIQKRCLTSSSL